MGSRGHVQKGTDSRSADGAVAPLPKRGRGGDHGILAGQSLTPGALVHLQATAGNASVVSAFGSGRRTAVAQRAAEPANGGDPLRQAIAHPTPAAIMAVKDFSPATNAERLRLLTVMIDTWWSNKAEEAKMIDIIESSGNAFPALMADITAAGLKQRLFDHMDDANKKDEKGDVIYRGSQDRLANLLWRLKPPDHAQHGGDEIDDEIDDVRASGLTPLANKWRRLKGPHGGSAPLWAAIPEPARSDLEKAKYGEIWFSPRTTALMRQTVLNLYVKLKGMGLWHYVGAESGSRPGLLHFDCMDVAGLKKELTARGDFRAPGKDPKEWESREFRSSGQLHFKQFKDFPASKVQAHIDQSGLFLSEPLTALAAAPVGAGLGAPFGPLGAAAGAIGAPLVVTGAQALRHGVSWACDDYKDVFDIRDQLLGQGFDSHVLKGHA